MWKQESGNKQVGKDCSSVDSKRVGRKGNGGKGRWKRKGGKGIAGQVWCFRYFCFFIYWLDYLINVSHTNSVCTMGNRQPNELFSYFSINAFNLSLREALVKCSTFPAEDNALNLVESVCLSIYLSVCRSVWVPVCLAVCWSFCSSLCLPTCLYEVTELKVISKLPFVCYNW